MRGSVGGIHQSQGSKELCHWWIGGEQHLLWLENPMRKWQSLPHCAQQNVEAGLSVWVWDCPWAPFSSAAASECLGWWVHLHRIMKGKVSEKKRKKGGLKRGLVSSGWSFIGGFTVLSKTFSHPPPTPSFFLHFSGFSLSVSALTVESNSSKSGYLHYHEEKEAKTERACSALQPLFSYYVSQDLTLSCDISVSVIVARF